MAEYLNEKGNDVITLNVPKCKNSMEGTELLDEALSGKRILILPVPVTRDGIHISGCEECQDFDEGISDLFSLKYIAQNISCFTTVCGGVIPDKLIKTCEDNNIACYDFMKDDFVAVKNAVATAEGAISEVFMMSDINICESKSLVTGYGKCGKAIAERLAALKSDVTVTARSIEACIKAEMDGFNTILMGKLDESEKLKEFNFCFNTVPALILTEEILKLFSDDIIIMDIASKPGGTDFKYCDENNIKYKHSLGIPGRLSPKTSGIILGEAVEGYFKE